jgi:hypothetical protein
MRLLLYCLPILLLTLLPGPAFPQTPSVTVSGVVVGQSTRAPMAYVNVVLKTGPETAFVTGTVTNEAGRFTLPSVKPGNYLLEFSMVGFTTRQQPLYVGTLTPFLEVTAELSEDPQTLGELVVTGRP